MVTSILWIHKGGSTRALQGILGHDHLSTTEIDLNLALEQILQEFQSKW
jgi:site-specific recombinase XerD